MDLGQIRNFLGQHLRRILAQFFILIDDLSASGRYRLGNGFQQTGFSTAVLPDDCDNFSLGEFQVEILDHHLFSISHGYVFKSKIHRLPHSFCLVRSKYKKNGAPINASIILTGTSPGGIMTLPTVSQTVTNVNPNKVEAGNKYL